MDLFWDMAHPDGTDLPDNTAPENEAGGVEHSDNSSSLDNHEVGTDTTTSERPHAEHHLHYKINPEAAKHLDPKDVPKVERFCKHIYRDKHDIPKFADEVNKEIPPELYPKIIVNEDGHLKTLQSFMEQHQMGYNASAGLNISGLDHSNQPNGVLGTNGKEVNEGGLVPIIADNEKKFIPISY
jgi:hypothetical protein